LTAAPTAPEERTQIRARRDELIAEITVHERALEEIDRVLGPAQQLGPPARSAA
jgi:hypothetical protein